MSETGSSTNVIPPAINLNQVEGEGNENNNNNGSATPKENQINSSTPLSNEE